MASRKLYWSYESNMFGTTVYAGTKDKNVNIQVAENMEFNPVSRLDAKLKNGYQFRSPEMDSSLIPMVFETLNMISGPINIWIEQDKKTEKLTGYAIVQDKMDAGMFAFANVVNWQKWSDVQQEEANAEAKRKPQKVKINKDGTVTVRVTSTSLADDNQGIERVG